MNMKYEIKPLTEEEETFIEEKINVYGDSMAPSEPHTEEEQLVFKVEDEDKNVIGGCVVNIHAWGRAVLALLWVDEQYRRRGFGSMLIYAAEKAAIMQLNPSLLLSCAQYRANVDFVIEQIEKGKIGGAEATPMGAIANFEYFFDCRQAGKIAPMLRYAWLNSNGRGFGADKIERHLSPDATDVSYNSAQSFYLGINWYITGDNRLKLQIGYEHVRYEGYAAGAAAVAEHKLNENAVKCLMQAMF